MLEALSSKGASPDLEHHQVVVVPLYLQDAGQSHHSCLEVWRVTWGGQADSRRVRGAEAECGAYSVWVGGCGRGGAVGWAGSPDLLSRLTRGSTALGLLEAASGSHFLYFSTKQESTSRG